MKKPMILRLSIAACALILLAFAPALLPQQARAEEPGAPVVVEKFTREELAQMLGPIALYPDKLLSQVLMASTYPLEVVEADRWRKRNPGLQDAALDRALLDKEWDPSVKALCHFPAILALMSERISETTSLGNAFLAQEDEVMAMVQDLRAKARAQGNLTTTPEQKVIVQQDAILIEPANPRVYYVPYYDPLYVYGPWWYPAYRPYYWGPAGVSLGLGISFWPGVYFSFSFGDWSYFDWHRHHVYIHDHVRPRFVRHDRWVARSGPWHHSTVHRRGVAYRDRFTAAKYGQYPQRHRDFRGDVRGVPEQADLDREVSRRGDERVRMDRNLRPEDNSRNERTLREQRRVERELQQRRPPGGADDRIRQPRRDRSRIESVPKERVIEERRERATVERVPREREQLQRERSTVERAPRQDRGRVEQGGQLRQLTDRERQGRGVVERERPQRSREQILDRGGDGRRESQSSERGRFSRQERGNDRGNYFRERGRASGGSRDGAGRWDGSRHRR